MTNYFQTASMVLPGTLSPLTLVQSPTVQYVTLDSLSQALAYDVSDYVSDSYLAHLKLDGDTLTTCIKFKYLTEVLTQLPSDCIRAKVVLNKMMTEGMKPFIDETTGVFTSPLTGAAIQMRWLDGRWRLSSFQVAGVLGVSMGAVSNLISTLGDPAQSNN